MRLYRILLLLFLLVLNLFASVRARAVQPVIINELMWMGSSRSSADEWIELRNTTHDAVDLSGWQVTKFSNGQDVVMVTLPAGATIPADGFFVISNYGVGEKSVLMSEPNLVTTDVALANSNLRIQLLDPAGVVIDVAGNGQGVPFAGTNVSAEQRFASMERNPEPGNGAEEAAWHTSTTGSGLLPEAVEKATPSGQNSNGVPQVVVQAEIAGRVGEVIQLDASETTDPEQNPLTFSWYIADQTLSGPVTEVTIQTAGIYQGRVDVSDGFMTVSTAFSVTITTAATSGSSTTTGSTVSGETSRPVCTSVRLIELLPNPVGSDTAEFMSLSATATEAQSIASCVLRINGSRQYAFPEQVIPARGEVTLTKSKWKLPNAGATIELLTEAGAVLQTVTYPKSVEGRSWSWREEEWGWAKATPHKANAPFDPIEVPAAKTTTSASTKKPIHVAGIVVAQTGIIGSRVALVLTGSERMLVQTDADVVLLLGKRIDVTGTAGTKSGEPMVTVKGAVTQREGTLPPPTKKLLADLETEDTNTVVRVSGTIQGIRGSSIDIEDDSGQGVIALKSASKIIRPIMRAGDAVDVTGVVQAGVSGLRIIPRQVDDLHITRQVLPPAQRNQTVAATSSAQVWWYWAAAVLGLGGVVFMRYHQAKRAKA